MDKKRTTEPRSEKVPKKVIKKVAKNAPSPDGRARFVTTTVPPTRQRSRAAPALGGELTRTVRIQPRAADAWRQFAYELSIALEALEEDEFLIIQLKSAHRFIQFAAQGSFGMRAEAVSDFYLEEREHLTPQQAVQLVELGWNAPTKLPDELELGRHTADGSPNYFLDLAKPVPYDSLAGLAVATLGDVFGAGHPGELEYSAFAADKTCIRFPHLGLRRRPG